MKDPVCGMEVKEPPSIQTLWNGKVYGFCSPGCTEKFKANPSKFLHSQEANYESMTQAPPEQQSKIKEFLPLVVIFSIVFGLSISAEFYYQNWNTTRFMQNFMAAFFIIFGGLKLLNWKGFVEAYQTYDILAKRSVFYGYLYPLIEVALGTAYLLRWNLRLTNLITLVVMSVSAIGVAQALRQKRKIQCACLGVIFKIPMTKVTLLEDVLMGVMAFVMLLIH